MYATHPWTFRQMLRAYKRAVSGNEWNNCIFVESIAEAQRVHIMRRPGRQRISHHTSKCKHDCTYRVEVIDEGSKGPRVMMRMEREGRISQHYYCRGISTFIVISRDSEGICRNSPANADPNLWGKWSNGRSERRGEITAVSQSHR